MFALEKRLVAMFAATTFCLLAVGLNAVVWATEKQPSKQTEGSTPPKPAQRDNAKKQEVWRALAPAEIKFSTAESAKTLADKSVLLSLPGKNWSEPEFRFRFSRPQQIREVRLEILPDPRFADRRLGRSQKELILFELKPLLIAKSGKSRSLEFSRCRSVEYPDDQQVVELIDYATDTGWKIPPLRKKQDRLQLVFAFEPPLQVEASDRLVLFMDTGGSPELDTLARVRFSFTEKTTHAASRLQDNSQGALIGKRSRTKSQNHED